MEFFLIILTILGGFFKAAPQKLSSLNLAIKPENNINASLLSQDASFESREEDLSDLSPAANYYLPTANFVSPPIKIVEALEPEIAAESAIVLDMETDKIIFAKDANRQMPIASISKIIAALAAEEKLNSDRIIKISGEAIKTEGLAGDFFEGEEFRVSDLIDLMLVSSSNDAAVQLALEVSGDSGKFAELMNEKVANLGLKKTNFIEPAGLSEKNVSTAFEIAQLADATFDKSKIWKTLQNKEICLYSLSGKEHCEKNTNEIIGKDFVISGKTGYTNKAKGTLVVIADSGQNNRKIILVVLGSEDRFGDTLKLIEWVRNNFKW